MVWFFLLSGYFKETGGCCKVFSPNLLNENGTGLSTYCEKTGVTSQKNLYSGHQVEKGNGEYLKSAGERPSKKSWRQFIEHRARLERRHRTAPTGGILYVGLMRRKTQK